MTTVDLLSKKIEVLKDTMSQINESDLSDAEKLKAEISVIEECEKVLSNDDKMIFFDFSKSINILENHNFSIENLANALSDIQSVIKVRKDLNMTSEEIPFEENQTNTLNSFIKKINLVKEELKSNLKKLSSSSTDKRKISSLENLKSVLEGNSKRKYYTDEMFKDFYEEFELLNIPPEEAQTILDTFYETRNLNNRLRNEPANFDEVVNLYRSFLPSDKFGYFERLLNDYKNEVVNSIDLENTRELLQFFKTNNVLNRFERKALLKVTIFGKPDYIENELYEKVMSNKPDAIDTFFTDELASVWVKESGTNCHKLMPFRVTRSQKNEETQERLYSSCQKVNYEEFWKNIEILKKNSSLFYEKFDPDDIGSNLRIKTLPTWKLIKNLEFCKMFNLGTTYPIPQSAIATIDLENKIHVGIETGLLNPPLTHAYKEMEKDIVRNEEFQANSRKKKLANQSIRNYFQRNLSKLAVTTINEYAYMQHKIQTEGYLSFYNDFFSDLSAGQASKDKLFTYKEKAMLGNRDQMDEFISKNFAIDTYGTIIEGYDIYDEDISEYTDLEKNGEYNEEYIYPSIFDDPLIRMIEENNTVSDDLVQHDVEIVKKNEYVYMFGDTIISRYKVLHNAGILKNKYGYLSPDMLLSSIVRNTFLDDDSFNEIYKQVVERGRKH